MRILIAVDGSECSRRAVTYLIGLHASFGPAGGRAEIACLHVATPLPARVARVVSKEITDGYYADELSQATDHALKAFAAAGAQATLIAKRGDPGEEIARLAQEGGFDLIVMGSHGHGAVGNLVMGSVATRVLASCKVPVLLVR